MRNPLKSRRGSVILYVLVVSIVVAVIAAFLSKLFLARYTLAIRQQNSAAGRTMSESVYAVLTTAWVPYLPTSTAPSCSDACFAGSPCSQCLTNDGSSPGTPGNALPVVPGSQPILGCKCLVSCNNPEDPNGTPVTVTQYLDPTRTKCGLKIMSRPD